MNGAGRQFLTRPAFPLDQDSGVRRSHLADQPEQVLHLGAFSDHLAEGVTAGQFLFQPLVFFHEAPLFQDVLHRPLDLLVFERLRHVVRRAHLHRFHRGLERPEGGDHHHRRPRRLGLHRLQDLHSVDLGHADVGDHRVEGFPFQKVQSFDRVLVGDDVVPGFAQDRLEEAAKTGLVVDHQDPFPRVRHGRPPGRAMVNWAPCPGRFSARRTPPWFFTSA